MKALYKAIASFQAECPVILKETSGHNYKYADLPAIYETINPLLQKNNLAVFQPLTNLDGKPAIKTIIIETTTGESMEEVHPLPETQFIEVETSKGKRTVVAGFEQMSQPQAQGSIITYYRRYCLSSILGLITDKDTDGAGSKGAEHDLF